MKLHSGSLAITRTSALDVLNPTNGYCGVWWCVGIVASKRIARTNGETPADGPRYYVCNRRRSLEAGGPDRACPQPSTRAEELDSLVWDQLCQALLRPEMSGAGTGGTRRSHAAARR